MSRVNSVVTRLARETRIVSRPNRSHLSLEEWHSLLAAAKVSGLRDEALVRVIYDAGLRASEPGKLRLRHARELHMGRLDITGIRTSKSDYAELSRRTQAALHLWIETRYPSIANRDPHHFIFPAGRRHLGHTVGISRWKVWHLFNNLCARAGIPEELAYPQILCNSRPWHLSHDAAKQRVLGERKTSSAGAQPDRALVPILPLCLDPIG